MSEIRTNHPPGAPWPSCHAELVYAMEDAKKFHDKVEAKEKRESKRKEAIQACKDEKSARNWAKVIKKSTGVAPSIKKLTKKIKKNRVDRREAYQACHDINNTRFDIRKIFDVQIQACKDAKKQIYELRTKRIRFKLQNLYEVFDVHIQACEDAQNQICFL